MNTDIIDEEGYENVHNNSSCILNTNMHRINIMHLKASDIINT